MGLKKKSKVSAEFSMSSLTDIIFLLLIFFMLTSAVVVPNALNMKIPGGKGSATVDSEPSQVLVRGRNTIQFDNKTFDISSKNTEEKRAVKKKLEQAVRNFKRKNGSKKNLNVTLSPSKNATTEAVAMVMDVMKIVDVNCILALPE